MRRRDFLKLIPGAAAAPAFAQLAAAQPAGAAGAMDFGMNLGTVAYWGSELPFLDLARTASRWRLQEIGGPFRWDLPLPSESPEGYPLTVPVGTYIETFLVFTPHRNTLPDRLTVSYKGDGTIEYLAGAELVERFGNTDTLRDLKNGGPIIARLTSTSARNPIRDLHVTYGDFPETEIFRPEFLDRLSGMSVVRFMDWMETNNSKLVSWDERPRIERFTQAEGGVALELMVALANRAAVAPWFTMPHKADDDYVRRFAEYVRDNLDPALPVWVEYSNEVWNGMFEQFRYVIDEGVRLNLSGNEYEAGLRFYSQRTTQILKIWEDVFGAEKERVIGVYAAHVANDWTSEVALSWEGAGEHADVLAIAPYFGGSLGDRDNAPVVAKWTLDQLFEALTKEVDGLNRGFIDRHAEVAKRHDVRLVAYEGGQHLVGYSGTPSDEILHGFFATANRDPRMGELYRRHIDHWREAGGSTYAFYNSMGEYSQWGCWGLLENEDDSHDAPKWRAVREMLNA
jgi:hypothetical protein